MRTALHTSIVVATFAAALYFAFPAAAQTTRGKLEIKKKEVYVVDSTNVLKVDTLIMHDKATVLFDPSKYGMLEASVAIIGENCVISAKGINGRSGTNLYTGENGDKGGNLSLIIKFVQLGRLTIDISGGDGGPGANGIDGSRGTEDRFKTITYTDASGKTQTKTITLPGTPGSDGTDATMGGNPGDGGKLLLMYSTNGFIPIFNHEKWSQHSIVIKHRAGQRGKNGIPGKGGLRARNGVVQEENISYGNDGHIQLLNMDNR
ncbi:hypothetical protein [uncultured Pontibacter sp.]|uniref:hypothetical protein n=1 Tax=uncultured Pontibacter sp. TaxID=453356 RepID=UPI00260D9AED|nr:hypothetical protein [uncultured Pontibacter sp.]